MSTVDKAELFEKMCLEADELARLGIAAREGEMFSPEREKFLMMELRYGTEFATSVHGDKRLASRVPDAIFGLRERRS
jgi:hypothetical protein